MAGEMGRMEGGGVEPSVA